MNSKHEIKALISDLAILVAVYGGIHVSMTSLNMVIAYIDTHSVEVSFEILLGVLALVVAFGSTVGVHVLTKLGINGWRFLATVTPFLAAFGGILVEYTPFGAILVAAFVPAMLYLIHPAKLDAWSRALLGVDEGGRIAVVLGAGAALLLIIEDNLTSTTCTITFLGLIIALLAAGAYIGIASTINKATEQDQHALRETRSIADVSRGAGISAYFSLIAWALYPLVILLVLKEFTALSSYGSSLDPVSVGWLTLLSMTVGVALAAIVLIVARGKRLLQYIVLAMLCILAACLAVVLLGTSLDSNVIVVLRTIALVTLPILPVATFGIPAPNIKGVAFHFWKGFLAISVILLLIIGITFNISHGELIYIGIYFIVIGFAAMSVIVNMVVMKTSEVITQ